MKKEVIFKCQSNGKRFQVVREPNSSAADGFMYFVYCNRKLVDRKGWYNLEFAMDQILIIALGDEYRKINPELR